MNIEQIHELLPHRAPFLFVDKVLNLDLQAKCATGIKEVANDEYFLQGHFPQEPIFPGVLIVEALAQISSILFFSLIEKKKLNVYLAKIEESRFLKKVVPGDMLYLHTKQLACKKSIVFFETYASVAQEKVAFAKIVASFK